MIALLLHLQEYADRVPPERNEFASDPSFLTREPWAARTLCSTAITLSLLQLGAKPRDLKACMGTSRPYARDYHRAILEGKGFARRVRIGDVAPGDLLAIRFSELIGGFTGHCAVIAQRPLELLHGVWVCPVVDSTGSPHGSTDPRALGNRKGLGRGEMVLRTDADGEITGYQWSRGAEIHLNGQGQRHVAVGGFLEPLAVGSPVPS